MQITYNLKLSLAILFSMIISPSISAQTFDIDTLKQELAKESPLSLGGSGLMTNQKKIIRDLYSKQLSFNYSAT